MKDCISRRSFMMLPALASFDVLAGIRPNEHLFHFDYILGTSMDLAVWMPPGALDTAAQRVAQAALNEVERLSEILNTRNPESEISRFDRGERTAISCELDEVLRLYKLWERRTDGVLTARPLGANAPLNVDALGKAYISTAQRRRRKKPQ